MTVPLFPDLLLWDLGGPYYLCRRHGESDRERAMNDRQPSTRVVPDRIDLLHRAGIKATLVERLRDEYYGVGDGKLAAAHIDRLAWELHTLRQTIWEMVGILGEDQDGAEYHHLTHPPLNVYALRVAREFRESYDSAVEVALDHG